MAMLLAIPVALVLLAQDEEVLRIPLKFDVAEGLVATYQTTTKRSSSYASSIGETEVDETEQINQHTITVCRVDPEVIALQYRLTAAKFFGHTNGFEVDFDSERNDARVVSQENPVYALSQTIGKVLDVTVDRRAKVLSVSGWDEVLSGALTSVPGAQPLRELFKEQYASVGLCVSLVTMPVWRVKTGDLWSTRETFDFGTGSGCIVRRRYKLGEIQQENGRLVALVELRAEPVLLTGDHALLDLARLEGQESGIAKLDVVTGLLVEARCSSEFRLVLNMLSGDIPYTRTLLIRGTQETVLTGCR